MMELFKSERFLLAIFVMALFGGSIVIMSFFEIPKDNMEVVIQLVGGVNMLAGIVIGKYFNNRDKGTPQ